MIGSRHRLTRGVLIPVLAAIPVVLAGAASAAARGAPPGNRAGSLDPSFGTGGKAVVDVGGKDLGWAVALEPDGKIVVAGSTLKGGTTRFAAVARLTARGSLDASFGERGKAAIAVESDHTPMALQPDGKVVVAGAYKLARLNANGSFDRTFGSRGIAKVDVIPDVSALALQPDGKIVVAGGSFELARLGATGLGDTAFGSHARATVDFGDDAGVAAVGVQHDGKVVVAGWTTEQTGFAVARLASNGSLDATFGRDGKTFVRFGSDEADVGGMALQPNGKIVLVGLVIGSGSRKSTAPTVAVARLNRNGTADGSFGAGGKTAVDIGGIDSLGGLAMQADGAIVVAVNATKGVGVARLTPRGRLDPSFGSGGKATPLPDFLHANAVALQIDGKIVVAGSANPSGRADDYDFAVVRLRGTTP